MTSLGGQFSARRLGDSPFTIRTEGKIYEGSQVKGDMPPHSAPVARFLGPWLLNLEMCNRRVA